MIDEVGTIAGYPDLCLGLLINKTKMIDLQTLKNDIDRQKLCVIKKIRIKVEERRI